jgi:riboflavin synthase
MFTGIIQEIGTVAETRRIGGGKRISIHAPSTSSALAVHDSVAVNGVCLTVVGRNSRRFTAEAVEETLRKTTLGLLAPSAEVNLELAMKMSDRLGGHIVLGHVDGVGTIAGVQKQASSWLISVKYPLEFARYIIPVGSIALDGISLTIAAAQKGRFTVSIIPYTLEHTTLKHARPGGKVNLEFDLIGKYLENFVKYGKGGGDATLTEKLRDWGYGNVGPVGKR